MKRSSPQRPRSRTERRTSAFSTGWPFCRRRETKSYEVTRGAVGEQEAVRHVVVEQLDRFAVRRFFVAGRRTRPE